MNTLATKILTASLGLLLVACGNEAQGTTQPPTSSNRVATSDAGSALPPTIRTLAVDLREWSVTPDRQSISAGALTIVASNPGRILHDLVIVQSDAGPKDLPVVDGRADESKMKIVGRFQEFKSGDKEKQFALDVGRYLLICNLPDHYQDGMVAQLLVK